MSKILSYCKPNAMSDEEWEKRIAGDGKNPTMRVIETDGFEVNVIVRGYDTGAYIPEYKKAGFVVHAKREIATNKLIHKLREKFLRKKVEEVVAKHKGGAGEGGK
jgi:hypothetical protein